MEARKMVETPEAAVRIMNLFKREHTDLYPHQSNGMSSSAWPVIPARSAGCPSTSLIGHVRWHALGISGSSPEIVPTETCLWAGSPLRQGTMAGPTGSARKRAFFALGAAGRFSIRQGPSPEAKPHCRIAAGSVLGSHACVALSPEPASLLYRLPVADKAINATFPEACLSMSAKFSYSGGITPGAVQFREKSRISVGLFPICCWCFVYFARIEPEHLGFR